MSIFIKRQDEQTFLTDETFFIYCKIKLIPLNNLIKILNQIKIVYFFFTNPEIT